MNNIEFDAYVASVLRLTRSFVVKINAVAVRDNIILQNSGYPVDPNKRTWRYYMNMNGDYHPTDERMYVKSVDTGELIEFTKANMAIHLATAREYGKGGDLSKRINSQYPQQPELIKGILDPIPYEETIEAEDYKILKYNKDLVLWNEDQLIPQLQSWINSQTRSLFNNDYTVTDNLMLPIGVIKLYADLVKAICTIRFEAIGTRYAHDFFIWAHIDSYGAFSQYKYSLTRFQIMWLYRNIAWVKNNPGQQYTFDKLLYNLLTVANIPLAKYDMVETTKTQLEDLTPTPLYRKLQLNLEDDYGRAASFIDTETLILKQRFLAKENLASSELYYDDTLQAAKFSLYSELPTKVLESAMSDYTNRHIDTLMSTLHNEWVYLAGKKVYGGKIMAVDPKNGRSVRLPVGDAYHIWLYLIGIAHHRELINIQPCRYNNVMKLLPPSIKDLVAIGGQAFVNDTMAKGIQNQWLPVDYFIAPEYLMEYAFNVYRMQWNQRKIFSSYYDLNMRARVKNAAAFMNESGIIELSDKVTYKELLASYELDFSAYTPDEASNFAWDIFRRVTGWDSNKHSSLRTKQSDLLEMMTRLSSYTIQIIKEMDDGVDLVEIKNETFLGDPKWIGKGNESIGDFSNARLGLGGHIEPIMYQESLTKVHCREELQSINSTETSAVIKSNDIFKVVDLYDDIRQYAVRMTDSNHFRPLDLEDIPAPVTNLDGTDYDELDVPTLEEDKVQDTNYGALSTDESRNSAIVHIGKLSFPKPTDTES